MITFPKSPLCLLWKEHDIVAILQDPAPPSVSNHLQVKNLQAVVVTPNEEAVIFITSSTTVSLRRGLRNVSKISVARITKLAQEKYRTLGDISGEEVLNYHLGSPAKCDIAIEEHTSSQSQVRVLIGHSNGKFEVKDVNLPDSGRISDRVPGSQLLNPGLDFSSKETAERDAKFATDSPLVSKSIPRKPVLAVNSLVLLQQQADSLVKDPVENDVLQDSQTNEGQSSMESRETNISRVIESDEFLARQLQSRIMFEKELKNSITSIPSNEGNKVTKVLTQLVNDDNVALSDQVMGTNTSVEMGSDSSIKQQMTYVIEPTLVGYIDQKKLEKLLETTFGRKIVVYVSATKIDLSV
jgi:hypothetical protein